MSPAPSATSFGTGAPAPDETFPLSGGMGWILRAPGRDALRCPLVVVEGFPGDHGFAFSWGVLAQQGVLARLQASGRDLVVVGLDDGLRSILENTAVVKECLSVLAARTALPMTLLGWSMGGLICRLALSELERDGTPHGVDTIVTWDTPHRGSVTQLGVQWLVAHLADELPALARFRTLLGSVANQEMDRVWLDGDGVPQVSPHRAALLERLAWPSAPRRILVASGRGDGEVTVRPGHVLVDWHAGERGRIVLRAAGGERPIAEGSWAGRELPPLQSASLVAAGLPAVSDGVPGGREDYPGQAAAVLASVAADPHAPAPPLTCTVPTESALDLDAGEAVPASGAAEQRIACATDQPHLVLDAAAAAAVAAAIGAPFDPDRFDPRSPGFLADPFPVYASFRRWAPMADVSAYGSLWCFRAAESQAILSQRDVWLKHPPGPAPPRPGPLAALDAFSPSLFSSDPPSHTTMRAAVEPLVVAASQRAPEIAQAHAEALLAGLAGQGRIELVSDYALPLPAAVTLDLLGVPEDPLMRQALMAWQSAVTVAHDAAQPPPVLFSGLSAQMALRTFWQGMVIERRAPGAAPSPGLLGELCDSFAEHGLSDDLLVGTLCDLLVAGYLSTTFLIATGTWRLLADGGDAAERVRADRSLLGSLVNELLRLDGPVQVIDRFAAVDTELGGRALPAGTRVTAVVGSADRDPDRYPDPDRLRLDRGADGPDHLAFGAGIHTCVGAPLVEQVAPVAFGALLDLPVLELDGEPQWQTDPYLRAATSVPVRIGA